jgi:hypothetical protein
MEGLTVAAEEEGAVSGILASLTGLISSLGSVAALAAVTHLVIGMATTNRPASPNGEAGMRYRSW